MVALTRVDNAISLSVNGVSYRGQAAGDGCGGVQRSATWLGGRVGGTAVAAGCRAPL